MKPLFILTIFLFNCLFCISQTIQFSRLTLKQVDSFEVSQKSQKMNYNYFLTVSDDYFPERAKYKLSQPMVFVKKINNATLETSYYYSTSDSTLRLIEYWFRDIPLSDSIALEVVKNIDLQSAAYFRKPAKYIQGSENTSNKAIWDNEFVHSEMFEVSNGIRFLVSWYR